MKFSTLLGGSSGSLDRMAKGYAGVSQVDAQTVLHIEGHGSFNGGIDIPYTLLDTDGKVETNFNVFQPNNTVGLPVAIPLTQFHSGSLFGQPFFSVQQSNPSCQIVNFSRNVGGGAGTNIDYTPCGETSSISFDAGSDTFSYNFSVDTTQTYGFSGVTTGTSTSITSSEGYELEGGNFTNEAYEIEIVNNRSDSDVGFFYVNTSGVLSNGTVTSGIGNSIIITSQTAISSIQRSTGGNNNYTQNIIRKLNTTITPYPYRGVARDYRLTMTATPPFGASSVNFINASGVRKTVAIGSSLGDTLDITSITVPILFSQAYAHIQDITP